METPVHNAKHQPVVPHWRIRFLTWFVIPIVVSVGIAALVFYALGNSIIMALFAIVTLLYAGALIQVRQHIRLCPPDHASQIAHAGLLTIATFFMLSTLLFVPTHPILIAILPVLAITLMLPVIHTHRLRRLIIVAWCVITLLVLLTAVAPSSLASPYFSTFSRVVIVLIITVMTLLLLHTHYARLAHLVTTARSTNTRLQEVQASLEAQVLAQTAELRASEARYRIISEMTSDYVYDIRVAPDGKLELVLLTDAFTRTTGYAVSDITSDITDPQGVWLSLFHPDDRTQFSQHFLNVCANQEDVLECRIITRSGETRWIRDQMRPIWDEEQQRVVQIIGACQDITDHKREEAIRQRSETRFARAFHSSPVPMSITTLEEGRFIDVNESFVITSGYSRSELLGVKVTDLHIWQHREDRAETLALLHQNGSIKDKLYPFRIKSGQIRRALLSMETIELDDELCILTTIYDVTDRQEAMEALHISEVRFRNLFDNSPDAIFVSTPEGIILDVNRAACRLYGLAAEALLNKHIVSNLSPPDQRHYMSHRLARVADGSIDFFETIIQTRDGRILPIEVHASRLHHLGEPALLLHVRDISERKETARQLYQLANHDSLTRLPNRKLFCYLLERTMRRRQKSDYLSAAVLCLDLDHFKSVNDSLGHRLGDELLTTVAQRLKECLRPEDTVARIGSDEFGILLERVQDTSDALAVAERLHQTMAMPIFIKGHEMITTASIGIALGSPDYEQPEDLLRDAGTAMYYAKELDQMRSVIFDPSMHERAQERLQVLTELPQAIEHGELRIHYHPIMRLDTGKLAGFEALVRWQHPERGLLPPGAFVPIAEQTGIVIQLGQWVLQEVCRQARVWTEHLNITHPLNLYVNLSGKEFRDPDLVGRIHDILSAGGTGAFQLKLEITENTMMDNADTTIATLQSLRDLGIELCIDDFGTGYSSLRYLQRFPVQTVKIDHSFVIHLDEEPETESVHIVKAILLMAHALGMDVIAEWIETPDQLARLEAMGCEYGQGYLFSRPLEGSAAGHLLAKQWPITIP